MPETVICSPDIYSFAAILRTNRDYSFMIPLDIMRISLDKEEIGRRHPLVGNAFARCDLDSLAYAAKVSPCGSTLSFFLPHAS